MWLKKNERNDDDSVKYLAKSGSDNRGVCKPNVGGNEG